MNKKGRLKYSDGLSLIKTDTKSHLNLCCERLFCRTADLLHPGKQFVQVIIAAVADIPRQGVVDGLAVVLQFGG